MIRFNVILSSLIVLFLINIVEAQTIRERMNINLNQVSDSNDDDLNDLFINDSFGSGGKSKWNALGLSILLPGAGQYYTERKSKAMFFGSMEALVWSGFFGLRIYGTWKKEDYIAWAAFHAGANVNDKDDLFFEKMTYYDDLDEYNRWERINEGSLAQPFPDTPEFYWNWDSEESRDHYRDLRNDSKTAFRRSLLFLGGAVANRLLSGIDAYRSAGAYNNQKEFNELGWKFYYLASGPFDDDKIEIGIKKRF